MKFIMLFNEDCLIIDFFFKSDKFLRGSSQNCGNVSFTIKIIAYLNRIQKGRVYSQNSENL